MARIYFLMWVSGSGKTTELNESGVLNNPTFRYVQSYTTRALRPWEINGEKYHHISKELFQEYIDAGDFLEWAIVHQDHMYGTKYADIVGPLADDINTIKEIEIYGLLDIEKKWKIDNMYTSIFLDIPEDVMLQRITSRSKIPTDELEKRKKSAAFEREKAKTHCDYIVDASQSLEHVVADVKKIMWCI